MLVNLCLWVNNSMANITHSFQGKATSSPSQFPWASLSWLIKLGLLTALNLSRGRLPLPFIFNIILAFFFICVGVTNLKVGLQSWVNLSWCIESARENKKAGKSSVSLKIKGHWDSLSQSHLLSAWLFWTPWGGEYVHMHSLSYRLRCGWWKNKLICREANIITCNFVKAL